MGFDIKDTPFAENSYYHFAEQIFGWSETNWQLSCVICKWIHQIFHCTEKTNNQTPKFMYFPFRKSHIVLLHQQLKYDRVLVFILREVIYRFHLFNIWSKFAVITQAENCFGVLSAVALFEINHWCGTSLLSTLTCMSKREDSSWTLAVLIFKTVRCWHSQGILLIGFRETQEALKLLLKWGINFLKFCLFQWRLVLHWTKSFSCHRLWGQSCR